MTERKRIRPLLEPIERISEALFGLIMVLTFTLTLSIAADRAEVSAMLIGALGCNLAWGIIDGLFYLMGTLAERGRSVMTLRAVRAAGDVTESQRLLAAALPEAVVEAMTPEELESLRTRLVKRNDLPTVASFSGQDWLAALSVFAWVFLTTFPVAIPFMFMTDATQALRVSNGIAIGMLFFVGYAYGRCVGRNPWVVAGAMVLLGILVVAMTIALGG